MPHRQHAPAEFGQALFFSFALLALTPGQAGASAKVKSIAPSAVSHRSSAGSPMIYFRAASLSECNVYMNYSYRTNPKFMLLVINPQALTPAQTAFVTKFNTMFATMIARHPDACFYRGDGGYLTADQQQAIYSRCLAQESAMGYSEAGWSNSRLPTPSNCISYRDSPPGKLDLLPPDLPKPAMSIEAWMAKANSGR